MEGSLLVSLLKPFMTLEDRLTISNQYILFLSQSSKEIYLGMFFTPVRFVNYCLNNFTLIKVIVPVTNGATSLSENIFTSIVTKIWADRL